MSDRKYPQIKKQKMIGNNVLFIGEDGDKLYLQMVKNHNGYSTVYTARGLEPDYASALFNNVLTEGQMSELIGKVF